MKHLVKLIWCVSLVACARPQAEVAEAEATGAVTVIDFLEGMGLDVNAAGPVLVKVDANRRRIVVANTLSSSMTFIDADTGAVTNVPVAGRAFQHLKAESMTIRQATGDVYLVGVGCFHVVSPGNGTSRTFETGAQLESIAVDDATGNVFVTGRESARMGFYDASKDELRTIEWLAHEQKLINVNQTPPPPIRKVVADPALGRVLAVDGYTATLHLFDARTGEHLTSRPLPLTPGGRWHLAGYDEKTHRLHIVTETDERKVIEAARIGVEDGKDVVVKLPELSEGAGIAYNPRRDEIYVPYDNHPTVHVVRFDGDPVAEIKIPTFGNDASALDVEDDVLYIASWAMGEIDVIDLASRKLAKRIPDLGIIPHMFAMALDPETGRIYFPKGASAVNGTFGAAVTVLDPATGTVSKIRTGWAPVDLVEMKARGSFLVFGSEDRFAEVHGDASYEMHALPYDFPIKAVTGPGGDVYLSYGPHQSYWPVVYIWGAKNGILTIDADDLGFYDRRIFRQAIDMAVDSSGVLYFTQNNWGEEEQFLGFLEDGIRENQPSMRLVLGDKVVRETTQRVLEYDPDLHRLYLVRAGETDQDPGVLHVIDLETRQSIQRIEVGLSPTDLAQDGDRIYIANFGSDSVSVVDKKSFEAKVEPVGDGPLRVVSIDGKPWLLTHLHGALESLASGETYEIPSGALPDSLFDWNGTPVVTGHGPDSVLIAALDPGSHGLTVLREERYPCGDTHLDTSNSSFYMTGQFGDGILALTKGRVDAAGDLWITDFVSGRLFVLRRAHLAKFASAPARG